MPGSVRRRAGRSRMTPAEAFFGSVGGEPGSTSLVPTAETVAAEGVPIPVVVPAPPQQGGPVPYSAEISRSNPTAFLFLIDQSGSMEDPWAGSDGGQSKADALATIINRLFTEIVIKCSKDEGVRNYFEIGVLAFGNDVRPALAGPLSGRIVVPVSEIADNPSRVEDRIQKVSDGAGGLVEQSVKFPIWFEPHAKGGTPMTEALTQ